MMFLPNIILSLSDHNLYNVCGDRVWCEVTHPLTNSNLKHNVLVPLNLFNVIHKYLFYLYKHPVTKYIEYTQEIYMIT